MNALSHSAHVLSTAAPCAPRMESVALDDPVPADSGIAVVEPHFCQNPPHHVERQVRRALLSRRGLHFSSLVVKRIENGVCLEGIVSVNGKLSCGDVEALARQIAGVDRVVNHLFFHS